MKRIRNIVLVLAALLWMTGCETPVGLTAHTPDQQLAADVVNRLREDGITQDYTFGVTARDGVVTINGTIPDEVTRRRVIAVVQSASGVTSVDDRMMRQR